MLNLWATSNRQHATTVDWPIQVSTLALGRTTVLVLGKIVAPLSPRTGSLPGWSASARSPAIFSQTLLFS